jgi:hypothetical protein
LPFKKNSLPFEDHINNQSLIHEIPAFHFIVLVALLPFGSKYLGQLNSHKGLLYCCTPGGAGGQIPSIY